VQRHSDKDLREVLDTARRKGWRVEKGGRYWLILCPNDCKCRKTIKCTPRGGYYLNHLLQLLNRATCWRKS